MAGSLLPNGMTTRSRNRQAKREIKQSSLVGVATITIGIRLTWKADLALASKATPKPMLKACNSPLIKLSIWLQASTIASKRVIAYSLPHISLMGQIACNPQQEILRIKIKCNREAWGVAHKNRVWIHSCLMKLLQRSSVYYRANYLLQRKNNSICICMSCLLLNLIKRALANINNNSNISSWSQLAVDRNLLLK